MAREPPKVAALSAQFSSDSSRGRNNEMVLDKRSVVAGLPGSVEAFFVLSTMSESDVGYMRGIADRFARAYGLGKDTAPPLVSLDFSGPGGSIASDRPFKLMRG